MDPVRITHCIPAGRQNRASIRTGKYTRRDFSFPDWNPEATAACISALVRSLLNVERRASASFRMSAPASEITSAQLLVAVFDGDVSESLCVDCAFSVMPSGALS
jgi:hypothetical protein